MQRAKEDLLVISAQKGDKHAFAALYQYHRKPLARFAYRLCDHEQMALDAVQDAWITLSKTLRKLDDPRSFRSWAYKTVRWRVVDLLRKEPSSTDMVDAVLMEQMPAHVAEPDATSDQLTAHLAQLSRADKQVITLFYLEDLKVAEIANILDIPVGTVKSRLHRARSQLRQQMTGEE